MHDILECKDIFTLTEEDCPCSTDPYMISCTHIEQWKQEKTQEQLDRLIIYTNDQRT